ncbi:MAG: MYG1 family protein, partial [Simkaniaceae bacterium]|nr:MYG1 family protein [Simkaniaceae bacterium]
WKLRGIPPTERMKMQVRHPLPEKWAGLLEEELREVTGIPGAVFCHKGQFISIWETKEDAQKAYEKVMS